MGSFRGKKFLAFSALFLIAGAAAVAWRSGILHFQTRPPSGPQAESGSEEAVEGYEVEASDPVEVSATETRAVPSDASALGGYDVLIADRGNNRIIEVTPDERIVWEYDFDLPRRGLGADDAFFADGGKTVIVNLEEWQVIQQIDYATKNIVWQYGVPGIHGSKPGLLHTPDDAYKLPDGDVIVADISNCRVIEIAPDKRIVRQYGRTGVCGHGPGLLDKPNGDTPLPDGHVLISDIQGSGLIELDERWQPVFAMHLPLDYPSDPQMTKAGNILIAGYTDPGKILEVAKDGHIVWSQQETSGPRKLKRPSLAIELPNGNILANDDQNHRVIVIDKKTHEIVWQYGVTGKPGRTPGQLNVPDGVDIIMRPPGFAPETPVLPVGAVSRHAADFVGKAVRLRGYVIADKGTYVIISDEAGGAVGYYDLPVTGPGISGLLPKTPYVFTGTLVRGGLTASNGNPYHLELSSPPER